MTTCDQLAVFQAHLARKRRTGPRAYVPAGAVEREFGAMHRALWCRASSRIATTFMTLWLVGFYTAAIAYARGGVTGLTLLWLDVALFTAAVAGGVVEQYRGPARASQCRHRISWPARLVRRFDAAMNALEP